jgi:hypothetical protein
VGNQPSPAIDHPPFSPSSGLMMNRDLIYCDSIMIATYASWIRVIDQLDGMCSENSGQSTTGLALVLWSIEHT